MKTEHEILELAFLLFLEKGFSEISTNEIIREAGLTKGGFYYSFKSREDLDRRVIQQFIRPYYAKPLEMMQRIWEDRRHELSTEELLWKGFFLPQRFINYKIGVGLDILFRNFYFLLHESMKKFPEVLEYAGESSARRREYLLRILQRGQKRGEIRGDMDLENYVTMILAMQDGIQALKVLDDSIDDEEKYKTIQKQMWNEISAERPEHYRNGGVASAVS